MHEECSGDCDKQGHPESTLSGNISVQEMQGEQEPGVPGSQRRAFQARGSIKAPEADVNLAWYSDRRKTREAGD